MSCTIKPIWVIFFLLSCGAALAAGINPVMVVITAVTATARNALLKFGHILFPFIIVWV